MEDEYENEDVQQVFEALEAARQQEARKKHEEELTAFWRDVMRIDHLDLYIDDQWDTSKMPAEIVGTFPKEPDYEYGPTRPETSE